MVLMASGLNRVTRLSLHHLQSFLHTGMGNPGEFLIIHTLQTDITHACHDKLRYLPTNI